jgi:hypothetical protein
MPALSQHDLMAVAVRARVDIRTVTRRLAGLPQLAEVATRIDGALRELGFSPPAAPAPPVRRARPIPGTGDGRPGNVAGAVAAIRGGFQVQDRAGKVAG